MSPQIHPHPQWLHCWAEHQFFNFSFQAVHLCLIARMSKQLTSTCKHASPEYDLPFSSGLFLEFTLGFGGEYSFETNIIGLKHEAHSCMASIYIHLDNCSCKVATSDLPPVTWTHGKTRGKGQPQGAALFLLVKSYKILSYNNRKGWNIWANSYNS